MIAAAGWHGVHGTKAHQTFAERMQIALALADVSAEYGDHQQAASDIVAAVDSLASEIRKLRATAGPACAR